MASNELKNTVLTILGRQHSAQLCLVPKINDEPVSRLADIEDESATPEVQHMLEEFLGTTIVTSEDMIVRGLSATDEFPNAVYGYDYGSYPKELSLFKQFNTEEAVSINHFNFNMDDLDHLLGYIVYIGSMESGIVLFRKHYPAL